ncbi:MAG: hypothetical protein IJ588_09460 [Prevotella sp.]|nr:hypothetical protein [Prevotella sp.]
MKRTLLATALALAALASQAQITEQPEGELKTYVRQGTTYENFWGFWESKQDGLTTHLVYAADGKTVYWENPVTYYTNSSKQEAWIEGELSADRKKITFPAGQTLYVKTSKKTSVKYQLYYLHNVVLDEDGYYYESFAVDKETPITLAVDGNTLSLEGTTGDLSAIIGVVTDDDEPSWTYYGDAQTVLSLFDQQPVTAPKDLTTETYTLHYGSGSQKVVNVGVSGSDLYIQGIYTSLPDAWLKGTLDGNTLTVSSGQYFGQDPEAGALLYWVGAHRDSVYNAKWDDYDYTYEYLDKITFTYDAETGTYASDEVLLANGGEKDINRYATYIAPSLVPFKEIAGVPVDPEITDFSLPEDDDEDGSITFYIYAKDADGNDLNASKLYYRIYTGDDQLYTFTTALYEKLEEDAYEFRYDFTDDWDFSANTTTGKHKIYFYEEAERIGVQVIYRGGGEEHASNIVYTDGTKTATGIQSVAVRTVADELFDLQGRRIQSARPGQFVIRRSVSADGAVNTSKILK